MICNAGSRPAKMMPIDMNWPTAYLSDSTQKIWSYFLTFSNTELEIVMANSRAIAPFVHQSRPTVSTQ